MVAGRCWHLVLRFGCCFARQARLSACHCESLFVNEVRRFIQGALDNLFIINTGSCHLCRRFQEVPALQANGSHCKKEIKTGWNQFSHLLESRVLDAKPSGSQIEEGQNKMRAKELNVLNCRSSCDLLVQCIVQHFWTVSALHLDVHLHFRSPKVDCSACFWRYWPKNKLSLSYCFLFNEAHCGLAGNRPFS